MKKILSCSVILFTLCLTMIVVPHASADLLPTTFQLRFEDKDLDSTPLTYRDVYVYSGDYEFKGGFNPYSYGREAQDRHWLLQAVKTDGHGKFQLQVDKLRAKKVYLSIGPKYRLVSFEKSSDIKHTPSNRHIRVMSYEPGTATVNHNSIYDLKKDRVVEIALDGSSSAQKKFKTVELVVQKDK